MKLGLPITVFRAQNIGRHGYPMLITGGTEMRYQEATYLIGCIRGAFRCPRSELHYFNVGDGATMHLYSDAHAGTIIKAGKSSVVWQRDKAELLNGAESGEPDALKFHVGGFAAHCEGRQRYAYERNENGETITFSRRKNGRWIRKGATMTGEDLTEGRYEHYDYNF